MMIWLMFHPNVDLGYLPTFLNEDDPRKAAEQIDANYRFGGWQSAQGFKLDDLALKFPGDPPLHPLAMTKLRDETILLYPYDFVAILQKDTTFDVARID